MKIQQAVARLASREGSASRWVTHHSSILLVLGFSLIYFAEICVRASEKTFWFDELCTLDVCKLPTFAGTWNAVLHGSDFNPPLFYVIEKTALGFFGDGLIALRLPQILGFWIFCLCLFRFVSRRVGALGGVVAMLIPRLTLAYFYAYDARPHGIVLGFCGLALVCWQMSEERDRRWPWMLGFALALECAFFTHCYSILLIVPFAAAELFRVIRSRIIDWRRWLLLILTPLIAVVSYVPLLKSYNSNLGSAFSSRFLLNLTVFLSFYPNLLDVSVIVVLLAMVLFSLERSRGWFGPKGNRWESLSLTTGEIIVVLTFLSMPALGILLARLINGPFFARYFISSVAALSITLGVGIGSRPRNRNSWILTGLIVCLMFRYPLALAWHRVHGTVEILYEPHSSMRLNMDAADPLRIHPLLKSASVSSLPILVPHILDYGYLVHYDAALTRHYFSISFLGKAEGLKNFLPSHRHFLVYATASEENYRVLSNIVGKGGVMNTLKLDDFGHFLAEIQMPARRTQ